MKALKAIFNIVELKKFLTKRNLIVFVTFGVLLLFFLHIGMNKYKSIFEEKSVFNEIQIEKANQYVFYSQYGGHGIIIMFHPSPLSILNSNSIINESLSTINTGEKLNIYKSINFEDIYAENIGYKGFFGIFLIFSVLFGLIAGYEITNNPDYFKIISKMNPFSKIYFVSVISKMINLICAFTLLIFICLLWVLFNGINLFNISLLPIVLVILLTTFFFLSVGVIIGAIIKDQSIKVGILAIIYVVSIFIIPLTFSEGNHLFANDVKSLKEFELTNLKDFMEIERQGFKKIGAYKVDGKKAPPEVLKFIEEALNTELKTIRKREQSRKEKILKKTKVTHTLFSLFPVTFYLSVNKEICGCGALSFIDFYSFSKKRKEEFILFIIIKKFYEGAKPGEVEQFTSKDDDKNIFYAKSHLPYNFGLGVFLTPFYTVLLLLFSFILLKKRQKAPKPKKSYQIEKEKDNPIFVLCENEEIKTDIFNYYQNQKNSLCLQKINTGDFMFNGVKPNELFIHLSQVSRVDENKAREHLAHMDIKDLSIFKLDDETILKIYAAVIAATDFELMVLNDFVKKESRQFQFELFKLLTQLVKDGKKIIYLSCEMKQGVSTDDIIKIDGFMAFLLDLDADDVR